MIEPKLCTPVSAENFVKLAKTPHYSMEVKLDGVRCIAIAGKDRIELQSREGNDITHRYPEVVDALKLANVQGVFDGEILVRGADGKVNFENVQKRAHVDDPTKIKVLMNSLKAEFWIFDVLSIVKDGEGLDIQTSKKYEERRKVLTDLVSPKYAKVLAPSSSHREQMIQLVESGKFNEDNYTKHLEGLVLKKLDSTYTSIRDENWLKWKATKTADCMIIGYTAGEGARTGKIGALVLAQYDEKPDGTPELKYVGKVGTGFTDAKLDEIQKLLKVYGVNTEEDYDYGQIAECIRPAISKGDFKSMYYVKPEHVCTIKHLERTTDGTLRQPVFVCMRDDKQPKHCIVAAETDTEVAVKAPPAPKPEWMKGVCEKCNFDHDKDAPCIIV